MADKRIDQLVAATTLGNNDLLVVEQNNQAKKLAGSTLASFVYNAAGEKIEEVEQAVADAQTAVDSLEDQKDEIAQSIADMAQYGTDTTLSTTGVAADAKAAGDRIKAVEADALAGLDQAEITGVPIATFDDGADDVPIKKLVVGIEPVQNLHGYDYPWPAGGGKNKFGVSDATSISNGTNKTLSIENEKLTVKASAAVSSSTIIISTALSQALRQDTLPAGTYIFGVYDLSSSSSAIIASNIKLNLEISGETQEFSHNTAFTLASDAIIKSFTYSSTIQWSTGQTLSFKVDLESGSALTGWVPYSNICPITGWTGAKAIRTGRNLFDPSSAVTGSYITTPDGELTERSNSNKAHSSLIKVKPSTTYFMNGYSGSSFYSVISINSKGYATSLNSSGSKTAPFVLTLPADSKYVYLNFDADQVNTMSFYESDNTGEYIPYTGTTYSITFPNEAGTVYGGSLDVKNGVLTVDRAITDLSTITWTESPTYYSSDSALTGIKAPPTGGTKANAICENYPVEASNAVSGGTAQGIGVRPNGYLYASKYGSTPSGNIVYELDTPITYTLTPPVVRTLLALNNIWADTGYVLDLIYRRRPISDADIQEQIDIIRDAIAEREDTIIASKNYTVGSLIFVEDKLVEVTNPITTGESIVVGTNCVETTVAAQIAYLKSLVDGLGNLAYLSYENA